MAGAPAISSTSAAGWAYGAIKSGTYHGTSGLLWAYTVTAVFGFTVTVNETNLSGSLYVLNVSRTMGAILSIQYCRPDCAHPTTALAKISDHAWETVNATSNLTTTGTVNETGGPVAALALTGSQVSLSAGLRESATYSLFGIAKVARTLAVNVSGEANLSFAPALGLVPLNITPGATWSASSAFAAQGGYAWSLYGTSLLLNSTYQAHGSGVINHTGNVTLSGSYSGANVSLGGHDYSQINYTERGPFVLREGFVLIPAGADLFGSSSGSWSSNESGFASATPPTVDMATHGFANGHLGFVASGVWFRSSSVNPATTVTLGGSGLPSMASTHDSGESAFVQGVPESPQTVDSTQRCLVTESGCPSSAVLRGPWGAVALAAAVVGLAGVLAIAVVARRRQVPPPTYPNAALYPPGQGSAAPVRPAPPSPREPETPIAEDDPLDHLW